MPDPPRNPKHRNAASQLDDVLEDRVACLADILDDVDHSIANRNDLSSEILKGIDQQYLEIKNNLLSLDAVTRGISEGTDQRRLDLEKELGRLSQEKRHETITCWQDVARLAEEARDRFREYRELLQKTRILLPEYATRKQETYTLTGRKAPAPSGAKRSVGRE